MMAIPVNDDTFELCTHLLGDSPINHGTPSFVVIKDGRPPEQVLAYFLESVFPANNAVHTKLTVYTERRK